MDDAQQPEDAGTRDKETRLMISRVVNENFKSYAGKQELGPFHKRFSSIVGPNGSGKSNVIDALLFVFGFRASKIRSQKVSSLIHNSDQHRNVPSCTVSVHFQKIVDYPGEEYDVVPNSQFVVSRTAYRDNSSSYHVNGKKVTFKEVTALLRKSGIDLDHNRFLILQGEVEQIAMMKPKAPNEHEDGMLEYLEDIVGSSRFKEPIEELSKQVDELNEQRGEKLNRVKAVEKEKDSLEGPKDEAVQFLVDENEKSYLSHRLFQHKLFKCKAKEATSREQASAGKESLAAVDKELSEHSDTMKVKTKALKKEEQRLGKCQAAAEAAQNAFAEFERQDVRLQEDLKHAREKPGKLQKQLQKERKKVAELTAVPEKNTKELEILADQKKQLEAKKKKEEEKMTEVMAGLRSATEGLQSEKEEKEKSLVVVMKTVNEAKSKMDIAKTELELYQERIDRHGKLLQKAQTSLQEAKDTAAAKETEIADLKKSLPKAEKSLGTCQEEVKAVIVQEREVMEKLRICQVNVQGTRQGMEANRCRGKLLDHLMNEKKSGRIPGIYGRLGDLGAIDDCYDVAISTACGPLDNIVVDTMETAQQCVAFLKSNNLGLATFIGMDKMERLRKAAESKISTPENTPRLFDLVKVKDARFSTVFYYALQDTLVADNMEKASRLAFKGTRRWRVVTLDGKLIEQSGAMSGGGSRVSKGRMKSSIPSDVSPAELKAMETELAQLEKKAPALTACHHELVEKIKVLTKEVKDMSLQMQVAEQDIKAKARLQTELQKQIGKLQKEAAEMKPSDDDTQHVKELQAAFNVAEKGWKKEADAAKSIEMEVQKIHQKIVAISGGRMKEQQDKLDKSSKELDACSSSITKAKVGIKTAERNLTAAKKKVTNMETELADNDNEIKRIEEEIGKLEEDAQGVMDDQEQAKSAAATQVTVVKELAAELAKYDETLVGLRSRQLDLKHEHERVDAVWKENLQKVKHWQKELKKLQLHDLAGLLPKESDRSSTTSQSSQHPDGSTVVAMDVEQADGAQSGSEEATAGDSAPPETAKQFYDVAEDEDQNTDWEKIQNQIIIIEERLAQQKPSMSAIERFQEKERLYMERVKELDAITADRDGKRNEFEALRKERLDTFMSGFTIITTKLKEMYQMITLGGDAELELVDSLDPFSEGIVFSVRPPKKSWKNISNLSGGEKTLSSLALVFALHHFKPTPLYVMDEIDAALDFKNVSIVANYIKERTKNAQFIIISLRNNMFELADRLVGIYKTSNCTKSVALDPHRLCDPSTA
ncbi:structural maintenance of chromosomes protein 4-like [Sycon ciliatum]|uniref:structural maintenance of chromosomes protein 4-like n=1 Tax=Sycon ciliatum TaxID=27933 RepID=UPI0031F6A0D4